MQEPKIDRVMFSLVVLVVIVTCIPLGLMPETSAVFVSELYDQITDNFGVLYQWFAIGTILFLAWLAFGRFGHIRLGGEDGKPDFSTFSWAAMLFCAGTGATLLVWAGVEWISHYDAPPFGAAPRSVAAIQWAAAYGPFHWGVTAWCFYALCTVAIAYPFYVQRFPHLCASTGCHALLGPDGNRSFIGRAIDVAAMIGLLGGADHENIGEHQQCHDDVDITQPLDAPFEPKIDTECKQTDANDNHGNLQREGNFYTE